MILIAFRYQVCPKAFVYSFISYGDHMSWDGQFWDKITEILSKGNTKYFRDGAFRVKLWISYAFFTATNFKLMTNKWGQFEENPNETPDGSLPMQNTDVYNSSTTDIYEIGADVFNSSLQLQSSAMNFFQKKDKLLLLFIFISVVSYVQ